MPLALPRPRTALLCGLLLCATLINYMDRQALASLATRIKGELNLSNANYGSLEQGFGMAFACGSLVFGFLADAVSVRWLYPAVLLAWSGMGIVTGFSHSFAELYYCRLLLGFFEAGHWPCAMQTIRRSLSDEDRGLGNSVLQSGASIGAIFTPIIIELLIPKMADGQLSTEPGLWRFPFVVFGGIGIVWAMSWAAVVRPRDLALSSDETNAPASSLMQTVRELILVPKFWVLLAMVIAINTSWQVFRSWLPQALQEGRGYSEKDALRFNVAYYVATDVGCVAAGIATKLIHHWGMTVFNSRRVTYTLCATMCAASIFLPTTPSGPWLRALWLVIGMGALGVFPCYYSFVQGLSERHPAKVFGILSASAWYVTSLLQPRIGLWIDQGKAAKDPLAFDRVLAGVGVLPLVVAVGLWVVWRERRAVLSEVEAD